MSEQEQHREEDEFVDTSRDGQGGPTLGDGHEQQSSPTKQREFVELPVEERRKQMEAACTPEMIAEYEPQPSPDMEPVRRLIRAAEQIKIINDTPSVQRDTSILMQRMAECCNAAMDTLPTLKSLLAEMEEKNLSVSLEPEMILIPAGEFRRGTEDGGDDEGPQRQIYSEQPPGEC